MTELEFENAICEAEKATEAHVISQYNPLTGLKKLDFEKARQDEIKYIIMD